MDSSCLPWKARLGILEALGVSDLEKEDGISDPELLRSGFRVLDRRVSDEKRERVRREIGKSVRQVVFELCLIVVVLLEELLVRERQSELEDAEMQRSSSGGSWRDVEARGDQRLWIDRQELVRRKDEFKAIEEVLGTMEKLAKDAVQPQVEVRGCQIQLSRFPGNGAKFVKHLDAAGEEEKSTQRAKRRLTCIYYLNADWEKEDGGELRVYSASSGEKEWRDVEPIDGRIVMFRSRVILHEVLPCFNKPRLAITMWMY